MGGSSSQVVGYRYYAKFAAFIGNRIEKLIGVNFDNRKWVIRDEDDVSSYLEVREGNLFGENEGGVSGVIDIHVGTPNQEPNPTYQQYFPLVSGYPYQSYLVFRSLTGGAPSLGEGLSPAGFYLGNSGYMKEMLLWVKRTRVRNDGRTQWFDTYVNPENPSRTICVAEIDAYEEEIIEELPTGEYIVPSWKFTRIISYRDDIEAQLQSFSEPGFKLPFAVLSDSYHYFIERNGDMQNGALRYQPSMYYSSFLQSGLSLQGATEIPALNWKYPNQNKNFDFWDSDTHWNPQDSVRTVEYIAYFKYKKAFTANIISGGKHVYAQLEKNLNNSWIVVLNLDYSNKEANGNYTLNIEENTQYRFRVICANRYLGGPPLFALKWSVRDEPVVSTGLDINPIHKIREILTDDTAMAKPESDVNNQNFMKAAVRIWNEGLGISWAIDEKSCIEAIEELCYHIEAGIRVNRQTGLYEMVLFRDDWFDEDEIHDIAESKIKDLSLEVMNSDDIVNQLNVTYYDRQRIKNSTFSVYENGSILTMGHANAESVEFPYFMNMRNAEILANWKLKQFATPAWSGSFTTGWREARKWNRYDLIRLPWSKKWNGTILVRIMKINLGNGTDNTVTIDFEEVIPYSGEMNTSIVADAPVDVGPQPPQPSVNAVFEAPYYLTVLRAGQTNADLEFSNNPDTGYVAAIAAKPQNNSLNALLYTDGGLDEFEQVSRLDYCDILQLDQPIIETTSSFTVTGSLTQAANSNNLILLNDEFMGFVSFDDETKVLTVKRGVLDTVPKKHNSGYLFVFDLPDVAFDSTQYAQSEIVEAQVLTTTPSGIQELSEIGGAIEIRARAIRPYLPANVKINGNYWPETHIITNDIVLTWLDRNRLQQTGGEILGFFDPGVTIESGVTYSYALICENVVLDSASGISANTASILASALVPNKPHTLKLWSVRDGFESYQTFEHNFFVESVSLILTATTNSDVVTGSTVADANITVNVDESLRANMYFDGSKVVGKAEPGATITIEIEE